MLKIFSFVIFFISHALVFAQAPLPVNFLSPVSESDARRHMYLLASDAMMGRNTPSPELDSAARYIASEFKQYGLEPIAKNFLLPYYLQRVFLGEKNSFLLSKNGQEKKFLLKEDFIPFEITGAASVEEAELIFAGYGITAPEYKYDDYANIDVKGKIVVILRGEPAASDSEDFFKGNKHTRHTFISSKARNAANHGAIGVVYFNDPVNSQRLRPVGFPWPSLYPNLSREAVPLRLPSRSLQIPVVHGGEKIAEEIFGSVENLKNYQEKIDSSRSPRSFLIPDQKISIGISLAPEWIPVNNVAGVLRGKSKPDEYVVVGAHYDHVGYQKDASPGTDSIYNGADDNASGTAGLLLAAKAFAQSKLRPDRSIIFVAFSGEEKGLYGSRAFVDSCPVPTEKIFAMLNMDMIGRNHSDSLSIGGNTRSPKFSEINEKENFLLEKPFTLSYNIESFFFRSDQANFARKNIPVLFYFTGEHSDYHKVGDEIEKINFSKLVNVAKLCIRTAWQVANLTSPLPFIPQGNEE